MSDMQYRTLGRTGERVSAIGVGGFHLSVPPEAEAIRIVRSAIDAGINFLDNSWDYADGESERRMGKALRDGFRDKAFLMTKIDGRTANSAMRQLEESLRRLQTDHADLLQIHELIRLDDIGRILGAGGALEALLRAREQGKLRYIGFTGHKSPQVHKAMLEAALRQGFTFDAVQMPLNVMDAHFDSFERIVLPILVRHEIGVLGMKSMGDKYILGSGVVTPIECLHYALSLPTSVVITGIDSMPILEQALTAVRTFSPLTPQQREALLAKTAKPAQDGMYERYKTTDHHDATERHPEWVA
ncbi:MAG: aldo/keto reductase [Alphaproteobacteria bacterium]|nr:aldo/keto reductase [Alphaproteobacteria bacterium]